MGAEALVCQHLSVARVADGLAVSWNTANNAVLAEGQRVLIEDPDRFDGVTVIGVDEHVWRHTRRGDKYVTVIIDLTPVQNKTGPAGCSTWSKAAPNERSELARRPPASLARRRGSRCHGRIYRIQNRHHRGSARRGRGHGPAMRNSA